MIDVLLGTKNRNESFEKCVRSLSTLADAKGINLFVMNGNDKLVDDIGVRGIILEYADCFNSVEHYRDKDCFDGEVTWPKIYNFLAKRGKSRYICYWSDDVVFSNEKTFERCERILKEDVKKEMGAVAIPFLNEEQNLLLCQGVDYPTGSDNYMVNYGLIRRSLWEKFGGLCEDFLFYCADGFLSTQIVLSGKKIVSLGPEDCVLHSKEDIWSSPLATKAEVDFQLYHKKCQELCDDQ